MAYSKITDMFIDNVEKIRIALFNSSLVESVTCLVCQFPEKFLVGAKNDYKLNIEHAGNPMFPRKHLCIFCIQTKNIL